MSDTEIKLIETKTRQIKEILETDDITYGMAKTVIQAVEADLLRDGNTFLNKSKLKNVQHELTSAKKETLALAGENSASDTVELGPGKSIVLNV